MKMRGGLVAIFSAALWACCGTVAVGAVDWLAPNSLEALSLQAYWDITLPLEPTDTVTRVSVLDDNLYLLTAANHVYVVHTATGVLRWTAHLDEAGREVRGPTHNEQYAIFTTPGGVRLHHRRTGNLLSEPRSLHGVLIDVSNDRAALTIGQASGVRAGDVFDVFRVRGEDLSEVEADQAIAQLKITTVEPQLAKGRLQNYDKRRPPVAGDRAKAKIKLPLEQVKLPFAASGAVIADQDWLYVGAANERFYSLHLLSGMQDWQLMTPKTVSATPILKGEELIVAGQDGTIFCLTKRERTLRWQFHTDGAVFADPVLDGKYLIVASSDRSLYCLDQRSGEKIWRERFDKPLVSSPSVSKGRIYLPVEQEGVVVLEQATGKRLWQMPEASAFLVQCDQDVYLTTQVGGTSVARVDIAAGKLRATGVAGRVDFVVGQQAEQSILLASRTGSIACYRSAKAPRLSPQQLADVLRDDDKIRAQQDAGAKLAVKGEETKQEQVVSPVRKSSLFDEWDLLRSVKRGRPLGVRGPAEEAQKPVKEASKAEKEGGEKETETGNDKKNKDESTEEDSDEDSSDEGDDSEGDESNGDGGEE